MHVHTYAPVADAAVMCSRRLGLATFGKRLATHNQLNLLITREILRLGLATLRKRLATHNQLNLLITRDTSSNCVVTVALLGCLGNHCQCQETLD